MNENSRDNIGTDQKFEFFIIIFLCMQARRNPSKLNCKLHYFGIEGYSVFLYYNYSHLLNKKDKFTLGNLRVFT